MEREPTTQLLVLDRVGNGERFVPAEVLFSAQRIGLLSKRASAIALGGHQADPDGIVERLFEGNTPLPHYVADELFGIGIERDSRPHRDIVASSIQAS